MSNPSPATSPQPAPPPKTQEPSAFGKYLLIRKFNRSTGEAFLATSAEQQNFQRLCILRRFPLPNEEAVQSFLQVSPLLQNLSHPNLAPVLDVGQVGSFAYLVSPYLEGRDLRWVLDQCQRRHIPLPLAMVLFLAHEIASVLAFAEEKGLLVTPLSEASLLVSYDGSLRLTEFFPQLAGAEEVARTTRGGLQAVNTAKLPQEDPFNLVGFCGALLHEMGTGTKTLPEIPQGPPPEDLKKLRLPEVPDPITPCLFRALTQDPAYRFPHIRALKEELSALSQRIAPSFKPSRLGEYLHAQFEPEIEADRRDEKAILSQNLGALYRALASVADGKEGPKQISTTGAFGSGVIGSKDGMEMPPDPRALIGQQIGGRYRIQKLLGIGGMGWVYQAEHIEIGRPLALKILHRDLCTNPEVVTRFRREARSASKIGHPNIVEVTDFGTMPDGSVYFVMELLEGIDLAQLLRQEKRVPEARVIHIGIQICRALEAAHQAGIIHRDMKPANVLLIERNGTPDFVKILDFGIAKITGLDEQQISLTRPGMTMGTPQYMAPEQAAGKTLDPRADVYAVGAILYELLTGVPPFTGMSVMEVLTRKLTQPPPPFSKHAPEVDFHPGLEALVLSCLERKADKRPQSCAEVEARLQALLGTLDDPEARKLRASSQESGRWLSSFAEPPPSSKSGALIAAFLILLMLAGAGFVSYRLGFLPVAWTSTITPEPTGDPTSSNPVSSPTTNILQSMPVSAPTSAESNPTTIPVETLDRIQLVAKAEALIAAGALLQPEENCALVFVEEAERRFPEEEDVKELKALFVQKLLESVDEMIKARKSKRANETLSVLASLGVPEEDLAPYYEALDQLAQQIAATAIDIRAERREKEKEARAAVTRGDELLGQGQISAAKDQYAKALSLSPKNIGGLLGLARVAFQEGDYALAVRTAREILDAKPNHVEALVILGDGLYRSFDYKGALDAYQKALAISPGLPKAARGEALAKKALKIP